MHVQRPKAGEAHQKQPKEQAPLIDQFNDFILLMDTRSWTNEQRRAYNALHRRIETVSNV